jgi:hypothetical protein
MSSVPIVIRDYLVTELTTCGLAEHVGPTLKDFLLRKEKTIEKRQLMNKKREELRVHDEKSQSITTKKGSAGKHNTKKKKSKSKKHRHTSRSDKKTARRDSETHGNGRPGRLW